MQAPTILGEPSTVDGWFQQTRLNLLDTWATTTGHGLTMPTNGWACEIGRGCRTCSDHLSIPCSLAMEAYEIALFLDKEWKDEEEFCLFFRLYLMLLSEFVRNLEKIAQLVDVDAGRPPNDVCAWANNFAKHRQCILIQHHPVMVAADAYGAAWPEFEKSLPTANLVDHCGNKRPIQIIDNRWFGGHRNRDLMTANSSAQAVIVVPPLMEFLASTMTYFRTLVDACKEEPERVKRFESEHFAARCR
jgi:hypothetical protein